MKTILVSGASGIVGYGTLKSLRMSDEQYNLVGASIYNDSVAPAFCDTFELAPRTTNSNYISWLCNVIVNHKIDMIIPGINDDMLAWNDNREILEQTGVKLMLNKHELIDLCADKWVFYERLNELKSKYLIETKLHGTFEEFSSSYGIPFILKPRRGFASKGIVIVDSEVTFNDHKDDLGLTLMAQPIMGTKETEYTISAFFDSNSKICCFMSLRRKLSPEGFTVTATVDTPLNAEDAISEIAESLKPIGPTNFQFRMHNGKLKLLEINPRISSATSIRSGFGYNESVMAVRYYLDNIMPTQPNIRNGYAVRYMEDQLFYDRNNI